MKETFVNLIEIPVAKMNSSVNSLLLMSRERYAQAKGEQTLKGEDEFKFRTNERKRH